MGQSCLGCCSPLTLSPRAEKNKSLQRVNIYYEKHPCVFFRSNANMRIQAAAYTQMDDMLLQSIDSPLVWTMDFACVRSPLESTWRRQRWLKWGQVTFSDLARRVFTKIKGELTNRACVWMELYQWRLPHQHGLRLTSKEKINMPKRVRLHSFCTVLGKNKNKNYAFQNFSKELAGFQNCNPT